MSPAPAAARIARHLASCSMTAMLLACASPPPSAPTPVPPSTYVVLLPNDDGSVGKVLVTGAQGSTVLDKAREAALMAQAGGASFMASEEQIRRDFGAALAARPAKPVSFLLYFQTGGTRLTPESEKALALAVQEISGRTAPDISIIGHTDTEGDSEANERLGMERARLISTLLASPVLNSGNVTLESHGEKNLLVPTPDNTREPRNRRVEVTVR